MKLDAAWRLFGAQVTELVIQWHFIARCSCHFWHPLSAVICLDQEGTFPMTSNVTEGTWSNWHIVMNMGQVKRCTVPPLTSRTYQRVLLPSGKVNLETLRNTSGLHLPLPTPSLKQSGSFRPHHSVVLFGLHVSHLPCWKFLIWPWSLELVTVQ